MCGSTGKWVYYNAINLLKDASLYAKYSGNTGSTSDINIASVPFLAGKSAYKSGTAMDDSRAVKLLSSSSSSSAISMTSETITPLADGAATGQTAGTWRSYGVVFYCDDYARTDLTACAATNQKTFYVGDPNPNVSFGTSASALGGSASATSTGSATPTSSQEPSGITRCTSGAADILGTRKAYTVQVCNLFGAKCWINHPSITAGACSTDALEIDPLTCKLYPIFEFTDNGARVAGSLKGPVLGLTVTGFFGTFGRFWGDFGCEM